MRKPKSQLSLNRIFVSLGVFLWKTVKSINKFTLQRQSKINRLLTSTRFFFSWRSGADEKKKTRTLGNTFKIE